MKKEVIGALLDEYLEAPEAWSDNVMIEVNPQTGAARLCDAEEADTDSDTLDYWDVMDLLRMSTERPGEWEADPEALGEMLATYGD